MRERHYDNETKRNLLTFVGRILRLNDDDISRDVKEEWNMIATPIKEVARQIQIRNAYETGVEKGVEKGIEKGKLEIAMTMLNNGFSIDDAAKFTGLSREDITAAL